jgi:chromosome segregation ATPase
VSVTEEIKMLRGIISGAWRELGSGSFPTPDGDIDRLAEFPGEVAEMIRQLRGLLHEYRRGADEMRATIARLTRERVELTAELEMVKGRRTAAIRQVERLTVVVKAAEDLVADGWQVLPTKAAPSLVARIRTLREALDAARS